MSHPLSHPLTSLLTSLMAVCAPALASAQTAQPQAAQPQAAQPQGIARSGEVVWGEEEALLGLRYQQLWMQWEHLNPPPVEALDDFMVRRRALIEALERELLWREAERRDLKLTLDEVRAWLLAQLPSAERPLPNALDELTRARLGLPPGASLAPFWEAAERVARVERLREALTRDLDESQAKAEWERRGRLISLKMFLIPRVPTSQEITEAIGRYQEEMRAYYERHPALFAQPDRAMVAPLFLAGGKGERARASLEEARALLVGGASLEDVRARFPTLQLQNQKSVNLKHLPKGTTLEEGSYSPLRLTRHGWTFYKVIRPYPGYKRAFEERGVQRECASAVLIERDELTHARQLADRARALLRHGSDEALNAWAKASRAHLKQPAPFHANPNHVIPSLGAAPTLHDALFELPVGEVSEVSVVRQSYVVALVSERIERTEPWEEARAEFLSSWREERSRRVLSDWLSATLKDAPRWVSTSGLKGLDLTPLKRPLSAPLKAQPAQPAQPANAP